LSGPGSRRAQSRQEIQRDAPEWATNLTEVDRQRARFRARTALYLDLGFDRLKAARFVAEAGGTLEGPALDVGTGKGLLAMALARQGLKVVSVEVSTEDRILATLLAKEYGLSSRIHFVRGDARVLPFPDDRFGTCAMMDVLHHLQDGRVVLSEMVRVLRPGGLLLAADFTAEGFSLVARVHATEGWEHPVGPVTLPWAEDFLAGQGLEKRASAEGELHGVILFRKLGSRTAQARTD